MYPTGNAHKCACHTLCHVLLEVARGELIQPLLELRGSGWFYFWLWCLTGRNKNTVTESVRENVVKPIREVTCVCPEPSADLPHLLPCSYVGCCCVEGGEARAGMDCQVFRRFSEKPLANLLLLPQQCPSTDRGGEQVAAVSTSTCPLLPQTQLNRAEKRKDRSFPP